MIAHGCSEEGSGPPISEGPRNGGAPSITIDSLVVLQSDLDTLRSPREWALLSASASGEQLLINVSVSGGCGTHSYQLRAGDRFATTSPASIDLYLWHQAEDPCDSLVEHNLAFDLAPVLKLYRDTHLGRLDLFLLRLPVDSGRNGPGEQVIFVP